MPFVKLLEADIGLALVPFLRLQALLRFMALNQRCSKLALFQLLRHRAPISEYSATMFRSIMKIVNVVAATSSMSGLLSALARAVRVDIEVLVEPWLFHYHAQLAEEAYRDWHSMAQSPQYGVFDHLARYNTGMRMEHRAGYAAMLEADAKYWKTSRVNGDFIMLFIRRDGTVLVSQDVQQVCLVSHMENSHADKMLGPRKLPTAHARGFGMIRATLLPLEGRIIFDGVQVLQPAPSPALVKQAIRAYKHAFNTNQLITALPKIPPPERVPVQVPSSAAAIAALRAKHAATVQAIVKLPTNEDVTHLYAVDDDFIKDPNDPEKSHKALVVVQCLTGQSESEGEPLCIHVLQTPEPTLDDYMSIMLDVATNLQERPVEINVDSVEGFHLLQLLFEPHGMDVMYLAPRDPRDREIVTSPKCNVCSALHCADGSPLLRCAACSLICYCSKQHQKEDWKNHKAFCMRYRM